MTKKKRASTKAAATPTEVPFFRPFAALGPSKKGRGGKAKLAKVEPAPSPPAPTPSPTTADTFALFMAGVRTLDGEAKRIPRTASELDHEASTRGVPHEDPDAEARAKLGSLVVSGLRFEVSDDGTFIEGRRTDVDPREVRRLRRGEHGVDGRLDLHGMTAAEAHAAVDAYVRKRRTGGDRVVLIVHGKGSHSPRGVGVLRGEIAAWLSQGHAARDVAAFSSAPEDEGGTGALLVLLAR